MLRGLFAAAALLAGFGLYSMNSSAANPYVPMWEHIQRFQRSLNK